MNTEYKLIQWNMRPMNEADVDAVMEVEQAAYAYPWSEGILRDCLQVGYCCWVAHLEAYLIGHGVMSIAAGECHILNICVHPQWQRRGLGRSIVLQLLHIARHHHVDTAFLEVRISNTPAIHLYRALGFNEIGMRRGYYPHMRGREDALIFAKQLTLCADAW